jgi:pimeloyl-ACP methyl ester carboxylesterase
MRTEAKCGNVKAQRTPEHVAYVGHSYGATFGGVIAGVEHRISAFVLMAGWYALSELARTSTISVLAEARGKIPQRFLGSSAGPLMEEDRLYLKRLVSSPSGHLAEFA